MLTILRFFVYFFFERLKTPKSPKNATCLNLRGKINSLREKVLSGVWHREESFLYILNWGSRYPLPASTPLHCMRSALSADVLIHWGGGVEEIHRRTASNAPLAAPANFLAGLGVGHMAHRILYCPLDQG